MTVDKRAFFDEGNHKNVTNVALVVEECGPDHMAQTYNTYVVLDEKVAVIGVPVDKMKPEWLERLAAELHGRTPDYLALLEVEPSMWECLEAFEKRYPNAVVVASPAGIDRLRNVGYFESDDDNADDGYGRQLTAEDGLELDLGEHKLRFMLARMARTTTSMMCYESSEHILFSGGIFGNVLDSRPVPDVLKELCPTVAEYFGNYPFYFYREISCLPEKVRQATEKVKELREKSTIKTICPANGFSTPESSIDALFCCYDKCVRGAQYELDALMSNDNFAIVYSSPLGYGRAAARYLANAVFKTYIYKRREKVLSDAEVEKLKKSVRLFDLSECDMKEAVRFAANSSNLILASPLRPARRSIAPPREMCEFLALLRVACEDYGPVVRRKNVLLIEESAGSPCGPKYLLRRLDTDNFALIDYLCICSPLDDTLKRQLLCSSASFEFGGGVFFMGRKERLVNAAFAEEVHVCKVCHYEYNEIEGDEKAEIRPGTKFDDLPDSWTCPICGEGKNSFSDVTLPSIPPIYFVNSENTMAIDFLRDVVKKARNPSERKEPKEEWQDDDYDPEGWRGDEHDANPDSWKEGADDSDEGKENDEGDERRLAPTDLSSVDGLFNFIDPRVDLKVCCVSEPCAEAEDYDGEFATEGYEDEEEENEDEVYYRASRFDDSDSKDSGSASKTDSDSDAKDESKDKGEEEDEGEDE